MKKRQDADYADFIALLANMPNRAESQLQSLELHKNAMNNIKQIQEATFQETTAVRPLTLYL